MASELNPRLVGIGGPLKGIAFTLPASEVSIGRDSSNQLWAADPAYRAGIACWLPLTSQFSIKDLKSRNGTLVNGVPIEQQQLRHGDQIYIGDSVLIFCSSGTETSPKKIPLSFWRPRGSKVLRFCSKPKTRSTCSRRRWSQLCLLLLARPVT